MTFNSIKLNYVYAYWLTAVFEIVLSSYRAPVLVAIALIEYGMDAISAVTFIRERRYRVASPLFINSPVLLMAAILPVFLPYSFADVGPSTPCS